METLIIEEEHHISNIIKKGLVEEGFNVDQIYNGEDGLRLALSQKYDFIVLDSDLSRLNGSQICCQIRSRKIETPILFLVTKNIGKNKFKSLNRQIDDYLNKPFACFDLINKTRFILQKIYNQPTHIFKVADLEVDPAKHSVKRANQLISLTPKEFVLLEFLLKHKDQVVSREQISEYVWDYDFDISSNIVDVFIATLRKKINRGFKNKLIQTYYHLGYKITDS